MTKSQIVSELADMHSELIDLISGIEIINHRISQLMIRVALDEDDDDDYRVSDEW